MTTAPVTAADLVTAAMVCLCAAALTSSAPISLSSVDAPVLKASDSILIAAKDNDPVLASRWSGYDIRTGATASQIPYQSQPAVQSDKLFTGKSRFSITTTSQEKATALETDISAGGGAFGVSVQSDFKYSNEEHSTDRHVSFQITVDKFTKSDRIQTPPPLTPDALRMIESNAGTFMSIYGTHFVIAKNRGCSFTMSGAYAFSDNSKAVEFHTSLKTSYSGVFDASFAASLDTKASSIDSQSSLEIVGAGDFEAEIATMVTDPFKLESWAQAALQWQSLCEQERESVGIKTFHVISWAEHPDISPKPQAEYMRAFDPAAAGTSSLLALAIRRQVTLLQRLRDARSFLSANGGPAASAPGYMTKLCDTVVTGPTPLAYSQLAAAITDVSAIAYYTADGLVESYVDDVQLAFFKYNPLLLSVTSEWKVTINAYSGATLNIPTNTVETAINTASPSFKQLDFGMVVNDGRDDTGYKTRFFQCGYGTPMEQCVHANFLGIGLTACQDGSACHGLNLAVIGSERNNYNEKGLYYKRNPLMDRWQVLPTDGQTYLYQLKNRNTDVNIVDWNFNIGAAPKLFGECNPFH